MVRFGQHCAGEWVVRTARVNMSADRGSLAVSQAKLLGAQAAWMIFAHIKS